MSARRGFQGGIPFVLLATQRGWRNAPVLANFPRMLTLHRFARALTLRCPSCGAPILRDWFHLHPTCNRCGLVTDRGESGYQVGSYLIAMMAIEVIFVAAMVGTVVATWPTPPWEALRWGGPILMLFGPVVLFPFTKTVYLAFDLTFRPEV